MNDIVHDYLKAYREGLRLVMSAHPTWPVYLFKERAKLHAKGYVPEGGECLLHYARKTIRKNKDAGQPVDQYSAELGQAIHFGVQAINREYWPRTGNKPKTVELGTTIQQANANTATSCPPSEKGKRATQSQMAELTQRYCAWAASHDLLPGDTLLAHFTGLSRSTWERVRIRAIQQGYQFKSIGSHSTRSLKVLARPNLLQTRVVAEDPEVTRMKAELEEKLTNIRKLWKQLTGEEK